MNALAFSALMNNPELLRNYSLSELQELAQRYPYAAVVYSMVALKAHLDDDGNYEHYLNQAAIRIPDRKKLYQLIHADYEVVEVVPELSKAPLPFEDDFETTSPEKEEIVTEQKTEVVVPPVQEEPVVQEEMKVEEDSNLTSPPFTFTPQEEIPVEEDSTPESPPSTLNTQPSIDLPGSGEVLDALSALKNSQKVIEEEKKDAASKEIEDIIPPEEKAAAAFEHTFHTSAPVEKKEEDIAKKPDDRKDAHSFSEWLSLLTKGAKAEDKPQSKPEEKPLPVESFVADSIELESAPVLTEEEKEIEEIIIDKQAKASLAHDDELVTETLAKIYEIQKKFDKAIRAYEILSLKYPEKKPYFADKIEKLKNR